MKKKQDKMDKSYSKFESEKKENLEKERNHVFLIIFGCIILFLLISCVIVRNLHLFSDEYFFGELNMQVFDYEKDNAYENKLVSKDGNCIISITIESMKEVDLGELGISEIIRKKEWVRQEFNNGFTWLTNYNGAFYVVQMYANDDDKFNNVCKKDFNKIKNTFSFLNDE